MQVRSEPLSSSKERRTKIARDHLPETEKQKLTHNSLRCDKRDSFKWSITSDFVRGFVIKWLNTGNWSSVDDMQLRKAVENKTFPHFLATFLWALLVITLAFNANVSIAVTGAVANGGLKVIMLFHLLLLFLPAVLCLISYRVRNEGIAEESIIALSILTICFSIINISLHFVNDFVLLMKATEVVAWSLYNIVFAVSIYRISSVVLLPFLEGYVKIEKERLPNDEKL